MFEPSHVVRPVLMGLLGGAMALGFTADFNEARADGRSSALGLLAAEGHQYAQSSDGAKTDAAAGSGQAEGDIPFSELNEALSAARARLTELTKAAEIAKVAGELKDDLKAAEAENQELTAALSQARSENAELQTVQQAASRLADESEKAASDAVAEARRLDEELVALRWQNNQLATSLTRAEALTGELTEELETAKSQFTTRIEAFALAAEEQVSEIATLQKELDATRASASLAELRGTELEKELALEKSETDDVKADTAKLAADLDQTITELGNARSELTSTREAFDEVMISLSAANQETVVLREQVTVTREEASQFRQDLEAARVQIRQTSAENEGLQQQVGTLRTAAGEATDAARLNLLAVENQINEINAALASVKGDEQSGPSGGPTLPVEGQQDIAAAEKAGSSGNRAPAEARGAAQAGAWIPKLTPARAAVSGQQQQQLIAAAASTASPTPASAKNPPAASSPLASRVDRGGAGAAPLPTEVAGLTQERQERAERLLSNLRARSDSRGIAMTVPGTILFAVNSEKIEPDAHDTLAEVAEMVDLYDARDVLIVGHTDAVGDDGYNQQLSERRAELVKDYFIDQFKVQPRRLSSEGRGETRPITSNATAEGRDANRRIEVIILN